MQSGYLTRVRSLRRAACAIGLSAIGLGAASPALAENMGYVQLGATGGVKQGLYSYGDYGEQYDYSALSLNGSARIVVPIADPFSLQLDIWANTIWSSSTYCYSDGYCDDPYGYSTNTGAFAAHLAYSLDQGQVGGLVSTNGDWATAALEANAQLGNFRLYGQLGASKLISNESDFDDYDPSYLFAAGVLAYYIDPNLSVAANVGIDSYGSSFGYNGSSYDVSQFRATWGARIEKRFEDTPLSAYLAYRGRASSGEHIQNGTLEYDWTGSQHAVLAGLRFALGGDGSETLQDLDNAVGLTDMNPIYGDDSTGY